MTIVGSVKELWRFPVKSMQGEPLNEAQLTARGVVGDRAYALVDKETGKVASAKSVKRFSKLLECQAVYVAPPEAGIAPPAVRITLPNGTSVTSGSLGADEEISGFFGRPLCLLRVAPDDFTIDQYHPDIEGADPGGKRNVVAATKLGAALFIELGMTPPVPTGSFLDAFPVSVITTSTLTRFGEVCEGSRFDSRRFRMNMLLETELSGFVENGWVNRGLLVGTTPQLVLTMPAPRCVMTTLSQYDLPADVEILRTIVRENRVPMGDLGDFPCAGVYAIVAAPGTIRVGDSVSLI